MNTSIQKLSSLIAICLISGVAHAQELLPRAYHLEFDSQSERLDVVTMKDATAGSKWKPACAVPSFVTPDDLVNRLAENVFIASLPFKEGCRLITLRSATGAPVALSDYSILNEYLRGGSTLFFGKPLIFINHPDSLNVAYALNSEFELEYLDSYKGEKVKVYNAGTLVENSTYKFIPGWPLSSNRLEHNITIKKNDFSENVVRNGQIKDTQIIAGELVLVEGERDHYSLIGYDRTVEISEDELFDPAIYLDNVLYSNVKYPESSFTLSAFNPVSNQTSVLGDFFLTSAGLNSLDVAKRGNLGQIRDTGILINDKLDTIQLVLNANNIDTVDYVNLDIIGDVGDTGSLVVADWDDYSSSTNSSFASVNFVDTETLAINSLSFLGTELESFEQQILNDFAFNEDLFNLIDGNSIQYSNQLNDVDGYDIFNVDFSLTLVDGEFVISDVIIEKW
ncbi:hypothetical protein OH460_07520 [Vibrio sp. Makdt]|uniref:hypothetical protein n=1 Tax=Vibrio sp. Makdt TaxID=2998828 RepID=UPI0022CD394E|nr:hypothetical protein [Vibrio sp. Makdt]MDA0152146.1 hypothetical protein [Vibrio sp. Makdt]